MSPWTGPVILTLSISSLALLVAVTSIAWQIYSWKNTGPKVKVVASLGFTFGPMGNVDFIAIQATNSGRLETSVQQFVFELPSGKTLQPFESYIQRVSLPARLGPGESISYWFDPGDIDPQIATDGYSRSDLTPVVRTGHGIVRGKRMAG